MTQHVVFMGAACIPIQILFSSAFCPVFPILNQKCARCWTVLVNSVGWFCTHEYLERFSYVYSYLKSDALEDATCRMQYTFKHFILRSMIWLNFLWLLIFAIALCYTSHLLLSYRLPFHFSIKFFMHQPLIVAIILGCSTKRANSTACHPL